MYTSNGMYREEARRADGAASNRWRTYQTYSANRMYSEQNRLMLDRLGKCPVLLEIGAGIGNLLADAVLSKDSFSSIHALDVGLDTAITATSNVPDIRSYIVGQAERLPYENDTFDGIAARGVIHHLENPTVAIREAYRVLKPGGRLVIFEGNPASKFRRSALGFADFLHVQHEDTQFRHLTPQEMLKLLEAFREVEMEHVNGLFAPLAYVGIGNRFVWDVCIRFRNWLEKFIPKSFDWWLLWTATK